MGSEYYLPRRLNWFSMVLCITALHFDVYFNRYAFYTISSLLAVHKNLYNKSLLYNSMSLKNIVKSNKKTRKIHQIKSHKNGWIQITIQGSPYERGYSHGKQLHHLFTRIKTILPFLIENELEMDIHEYYNIVLTKIKPQIKRLYPEFFSEMHGIADGSNTKLDFIVAWNAFLSMYSYHKVPKDRTKDASRCSAFIACGKHTKTGKIVMAHNTHSEYVSASLCNIILTIIPEKGNTIKMQTYPGFIASGTDWFLCNNGIIGCETTISQTNYMPKFGAPYFCRVRQAMQYANTLDEFSQTLLHNNAGDYACSWLLGDTNNNTIMLCEIGLHHKNIETKTDGVFYGANSAMDFELRSMETTDNTFDDLSKSSGARNARLDFLLNREYYGKLDVHSAKKILADHYDVYTSSDSPGIRTICKHSELSDESKKMPFFPHGCVDGKVIDSSMSQKMQFIGRMGSSCGRIFNVKEYLRQHPQPEYKKWGKYLTNILKREWVKL